MSDRQSLTERDIDRTKVKRIRKKPKPLKLFVWNDVFTDYFSGIAFALARNVEQARKLIIEQCCKGTEAYAAKELARAPDVVTRRPYGGQSSGGG